MSDEIHYEWLNGKNVPPDLWDKLDEILATRGWMSLSRETSRIRLATCKGELKGFIVLQLMPHLGPAWVAPGMRGSGIMETLVEDMEKFLVEVHARGCLVIADNPLVAKRCEDRGLRLIESPVYTTEVA